MPGRHAEGVGRGRIRRRGEDGARRRDPPLDRRVIRRRGREHLEGAGERVVPCAGEPRTEVRGLHGAGAASRGDRETRAEELSHAGRVGIGVLAAPQRVPAHHADEPPRARPRRQRPVDAIVVKGAGEQPVLLRALRPRIGAAVERAAVRHVVVELIRRVERIPVRIDRRRVDSRQHQRASGLVQLGIARGERAAGERRAGGVALGEHLAPLAQIEPDEPPAAQPVRALREPPIELGERLDGDDASRAVLHPFLRPGNRARRSAAGEGAGEAEIILSSLPHGPVEECRWMSAAPARLGS